MLSCTYSGSLQSCNTSTRQHHFKAMTHTTVGKQQGGDASILNILEGLSAYISQCWHRIAESQSKSDRSTTLCPITFRAQETLHSNSWAMPYLKTTIMYSFGRISPKPSTHNSPQACRQDKHIGHCVHTTCFSTINKLLQTHSAALTTRL